MIPRALFPLPAGSGDPEQSWRTYGEGAVSLNSDY